MAAIVREIRDALNAPDGIFWAGTHSPRFTMISSADIYDPAADFRLPPDHHQQFQTVFLVERDLGAIKQWPLVLDEALRLLAPGGTIVIRTSQTRLLSLFELAYFVERWTGGQIEPVAQTQAQVDYTLVFRLTHAAPRPASFASFGFGVITDGKKREGLIAFVNSVRTMRNPHRSKIEILVCGPADTLDGMGVVADDVILVEQPSEFSDKGWITRKKNLIVRASNAENILIAHDRYTIDSAFLVEMEKFGSDFAVVVPRQETTAGHRIPDWVMVADRLNWSTPGWMDYGDYHPQVYLNGGVTIGKTELLRKVGWSDLLFWGQAEDIELTRRLQDAGATPRLARNVKLLTAPTRPGFIEGFERLPWLLDSYADTNRPGWLGDSGFVAVPAYRPGTFINFRAPHLTQEAQAAGMVVPREWTPDPEGASWSAAGLPGVSLKLSGAVDGLTLFLWGPAAELARISAVTINQETIPVVVSPGSEMATIDYPASAIPGSNIAHISFERRDAAPLRLTGIRLSARSLGNCSLGVPLSITDKNAAGFLIDGWHAAESWGAWTGHTTARLALRMAEPTSGDLHLQLTLRAFAPPALPPLHASVLVNGMPVLVTSFTAASAEQVLHMVAPQQLVTDEQLLVEFRTSRVASPASVGVPDDPRPLGLGLLGVMVSQ